MGKLADEVPVATVPDVGDRQFQLGQELIINISRNDQQPDEEKSQIGEARFVGIGILKWLKRHVRWTNEPVDSNTGAPALANENAITAHGTGS